MPSHPTAIGVLALQGDFAAHSRMLNRVGCTCIEVRKPSQLDDVAGLIIPGGESTTLLKLMSAGNFELALRAFHAAGKPIFGTCAGVILLATQVTNPIQQSLGLLDVTVERNSYGRQIDSFEVQGSMGTNGSSGTRPLEMVFIRAPRIVRVGPSVNILARYQNEPVLVSAGRILGATFHPEMTSDPTVHDLFVTMCRSAR
jgi:pyridoxal 5'-phosphate synthase pdxT subunit